MARREDRRKDDEAGRLSRRAASGDLAAARRLVRLLEERQGVPDLVDLPLERLGYVEELHPDEQVSAEEEIAAYVDQAANDRDYDIDPSVVGRDVLLIVLRRFRPDLIHVSEPRDEGRLLDFSGYEHLTEEQKDAFERHVIEVQMSGNGLDETFTEEQARRQLEGFKVDLVLDHVLGLPGDEYFEERLGFAISKPEDPDEDRGGMCYGCGVFADQLWISEFGDQLCAPCRVTQYADAESDAESDAEDE